MLKKPFPGKDLSNERRIFNYRLSQARRRVECAFGIPTAKRRMLNEATETNVSKSEIIVKCTGAAFMLATLALANTLKNEK
jgi:hypothetical protein